MADREDRVSEQQRQSGDRYAAFVSYSHADEEFCTWLHKRLESYEVPRALVDRQTSTARIGKRLGRIFRDRVELSAAHDLGTEIQRALRQSSALILLCSPRACGSKYVGEEIATFKRLGKGDRIFAAIVEGEPHATGKPGRLASDECFPDALLFRVTPNGELTSEPEPNEPFAADFREGKDGRENGSLKLIAGLLGVGLDELVQREKQAERARRRRANFIAAAMAALALAAAAAGVFAWQNEQRARNSLARIFAERSWQAMERGDYPLAMRYALAGWRAAPANESEYRNALGSILFHAGESRVLLRNPITLSSGAVLSPDGTRIVAGSNDTDAHVWDAATGQQIALLDGHGGSVLTVAFSWNGALIVTASNDDTIRLWDPSSGREVGILQGLEGVRTAAFSPDGTQIVAAYDDNVARIWRTESASNPEGPWREIRVLRGHDQLVVSAAFSADGTRIVTGSADRTARVWDALSGREISVMRGHDQSLRRAAFSADGTRIVTGSFDGSARVWDVSSGRELAVLGGRQGVAVNDANFSADGGRIVTASADGVVRVWAPTGPSLDADWIESGALRGHERSVRSASFSRDGAHIVSASDDYTVRVWESATDISEDDGTFAFSHGLAFADTLFIPDFRHILTLRNRTWQAANGSEIDLTGNGGIVTTAAFSPDSARLVITSEEDSTARVWDTADGRSAAILRGHEGPLTNARFNEAGTRILTSSVDGSTRVWDAANFRELAVVPTGRAIGARLSSDNARLLTTHDDGTARLWNVASGAELVVLSGHGDVLVTGAELSPDGTRIVTVTREGVARVWDAGKGRLLAVLTWEGNVITLADFNDDGTQILTLAEGNVRTWNISRLTQSVSELARAACANFLPVEGRRFSERELGDDLIREVWLRGHSADRDVCEGVPGAPALE